jgi:hypothetical protein
MITFIYHRHQKKNRKFYFSEAYKLSLYFGIRCFLIVYSFSKGRIRMSELLKTFLKEEIIYELHYKPKLRIFCVLVVC